MPVAKPQTPDNTQCHVAAGDSHAPAVRALPRDALRGVEVHRAVAHNIRGVVDGAEHRVAPRPR